MTEGDNNPKADCIISAPKFAENGFMSFESAWAQPLNTERASVWRALAVDKV
jgi:hypothetical protein